jgi:hypothetical protein
MGMNAVAQRSSTPDKVVNDRPWGWAGEPSGGVVVSRFESAKVHTGLHEKWIFSCALCQTGPWLRAMQVHVHVPCSMRASTAWCVTEGHRY